MLTRRRLLSFAPALLAAPAIVRASSLMRVSVQAIPIEFDADLFCRVNSYLFEHVIRPEMDRQLRRSPEAMAAWQAVFMPETAT